MTAFRNAAPRALLSVVRILIGSYFLAKATGLILDPASRSFLDAVLPLDVATTVTTVYLYVTAFAVMIGWMARPAALLLAVFTFWSATVHFGAFAELSQFWADMALLGALLMIAAVAGGPARPATPAEDHVEPPENIFADIFDDQPMTPARIRS